MSKLQIYVLKEVLKALVPGFIALLLVMMLGFGMQLLQEGLDVVRLSGFFVQMAIYCAPWVLPSALLAAVIMSFGRLSADKEILAMQVEGVHLWHIIYPIYILAVFLSFSGAYLHFQAAPAARYRIESMQSEAVMQVVKEQIVYSAGRQFHISPYIVSYERYENERMENMSILEYGREGALYRIINAASGTLRQAPERPHVLELVLNDLDITMVTGGERISRQPSAGSGRINLHVGSSPGKKEKGLKHMTFPEMRAERRELLRDVSGHERLYRNPDEKSDIIDDKARPLREKRDELRERLQRAENRLKNIHIEISLTEQGIKDRRNRIENWETDMIALREQRLEYGHELWKLDEKEEKGEDWLKTRTEVQKQLENVRSQMGELETKMKDVKAELEGLFVDKEGGKQQLERQEAEIERLVQETGRLSEEVDELASARRDADTQATLREVGVRFHRRLTLAFAALMFAVLGIPLGLLSKRRSTLIAFGAGFFVMLAVFYPFMVLGQIMAETGMMHVIPAMWMGNGITFLIGASITLALFRH